MGLDPRRVVQVICDSPVQGLSWRGSGYLLNPTTVLTAAHVVAGVSTARVRLDAGQQAERTLDGRCEALGDDLALVHLWSADVVLPSARPPLLGHLGSRPLLVDAVAAGYPLFRLVTAAPGEEAYASAKPFRDFAQVPGEIAALDGWRSGTITFHVDVRFVPYGQVPTGRSSWEGMSGAALWVNECLVGVISQDADPDRPARLIAVRLEAAVRAATSTAERAALSEELFGASFVDATADARGQAVLLDHRRQARRRIHDTTVIGRGEELALMQEFCAGDGTLLLWRGQEWAGKTALMSAFVAEPPGNVDVVSFFVNDRTTTERDLSGFLASMGRQLEAVLDSPQGSRLDSPGALEGAFWRLAEDAAAASEDRGRRLVVVVDGLDEDAAQRRSTRVRSIAALFSDPLPRNLRVILATRPDDRVFEEIGQKSDIDLHDLSPSPLAGVSKAEARADIDDAVYEDGLARQLLGLLTAARSGLAHGELAELVFEPPGVVLSVLQTSLRHCVHRMEIHEGDFSSRTVFGFANQSLPEIVGDDNHLGRSGVHRYVERIHTWATESTSRGWDDDVPDFLALGYRAMLVAADDLPRLLEYALDSDRQEWLRGRLGNDLAAIDELEQAERLNRAGDRPDLGRATRLARSRDALRDRSSSLSSPALTVLAAAGHWRRAGALAHGAGDDYLAVVAGELVKTAEEDLEPASTVTHLIKAPLYAAPSLCELALAQHTRGLLGRAEETVASALASARKVDDFSGRVTLLTQVAAALTTIGLQSMAGAAIAHAAEAAHQIVDDRSRAASLMGLATSLASTEGPGSAQPVVDEALAIARGVDDPARAAALLTAIASFDDGGLVSHDDRAGVLLEAYRAAERIGSVEDRSRALAALSLAQVHFDFAYEFSLEKAIRLAAQVDYPKFHAEILEACAKVLASAGHRERAASLLEEAVTVADVYDSHYEEYTWWRRADTLISLAHTQARQGLHQAARDTGTTCLEHDQQRTLASIADIQIDDGELDEAATTIQLISEPDYYVPASGRLTCALARNRDPSANSRLDEFVGVLERVEAGHRASNNLRSALGQAALAAHYLGRVERAVELAELSLAAEQPIDPLERVDVLLEIGRAYVAADNTEMATQHFEEAMEIAEGLDAGDEPLRRSRYDEAIAAVAVAQAAVGQYSRALAAIAQLQRSAWPAWQQKARAYTAIASLQVQSGQTTDADTTFSHGVATALQEYDPFEAQRTGSMIESIVLAQARAGRQSAAWATAEELREEEKLKDVLHANYADRCLAKMAQYYASGSRHDDARKTAEHIRDADIRGDIEQSLSDGATTGSAGAAWPVAQADPPDAWESRARLMLDQLESEAFPDDTRSPAGQTILDLAGKARVHGSHGLAVKLVAAAFALLPCHNVLEWACRVEPSLGTLLEELEPW